MAIGVTRAVLIQRSRADVAAFMFDPSHDAIWTSCVTARIGECVIRFQGVVDNDDVGSSSR
jgi:hypothetical protein